MDRTSTLKAASIISIAGNLALAAIKVSAGFYAGSYAVLGDGLDSLTDVLISFITLVTSNIISREADMDHPYGHYRAETIATTLLAFIIFFSGGQLVITTTGNLIHGDTMTLPDPLAIYVIVVSIIGKIVLSLSQYYMGRRIDSSLLLANSQNMRNDVIMSAGVLAGLGFTFILGLPVLDRAFAIIIGLWIMASAVRILMGTITELMDGYGSKDIYTKIFAAIENLDIVANPHRVRIRKLGAFIVIDLDVEVDGSLRVKDAHERVKMVEAEIRKSIPNIYDIVIHVEPLGNIEENERFGLTRKNID